MRSLGPAIELRMRLPTSLWQVDTDPSQLDAAILNIVSNARAAMADGGVLVLDARNTSLPDHDLPEAGKLVGDYVCLTITDSGDGMSEDTAQQAFEPFFTTKAVGKGTGLGLSQVYGFAIQGGGRAFIRREQPGTTIGVLLPRSMAAAAAVAPAPALHQEIATDLRGVRMLCVEDDPAVAETTVALLRNLGVRVEVASSGDAAVELDFSKFDLVMSDVMMPGRIDGIGLASWLAVHHPTLPVVLCSGYMVEPSRLQALRVELVRKPYRFTELVHVIQGVLRGGGRGRGCGRENDAA
jgi:CheY-like chemotaxis protein